jgi:hypothetical protein
VLLTDHTANNVIIYSPEGRLMNKWGTEFPGAHGLTLVEENREERLFITDLHTHRVVKTSMDGHVLSEWGWPEETGKYEKESDYRPSWTLPLPDGGFIVMDGYGKDYFVQYDASGKLTRIFGGAEGGIVHWGPHGGMTEHQPDGNHSLLVAMSDQQYLLRLDPMGRELERKHLPGGNPRQIRSWQKHFVCAHLADNWPKNRSSRGFISILDHELRVVSNVGGTSPEYEDSGKLRAMRSEGETFLHPHDAVVGKDGALYVAQFASGNTYPVKLERV